MTTLPSGWTEVALGEVCEIVMGQAPKGSTYNDGGDGWPLIAGAGDFSQGLPRAKKYTTAPTRLSVPGDIVLGIRASIGAKVLADDEYCLGRGVAALRATDKLDKRFLWHWLTVSSAALAAKGRGATFLQVNRRDIAEMPLPLPPLEAQRRIAAILDKADELRAKRRTALDKLDSLTQSIFLDVFGDPALNTHGWPEKSLGELGLVATGGTPSRERPEYFDGCIPWVKTAEVDGGTIRRTSESISEDALRDSNCQVFPEGSVVIAMYGQGATRGRTSILGLPAATNQACAVVVTGDLIESTYLHTALQLAYHRLRGLGRGGNQANLNLSLVRSFEVPVPPLRMQEEFTRARTRLEEIRRTAADADIEMAALRSSLEALAFSGVL